MSIRNVFDRGKHPLGRRDTPPPMRFEAAAIYDQGLRDIDVAGSCGATVYVFKLAKDEGENSGGEYLMSLAAVAQGAIHNIDAVASGIANADSSRFAHAVKGCQSPLVQLEVRSGATRRARFQIPCLEGDDHCYGGLLREGCA